MTKEQKKYHIDFSEKKEVECAYKTMTISFIESLWKQDKMFVDYYQRQNTVWKKEQQKLLIDSLQRGYGIPALIINKRSDGRYAVIDGQQRITAILDYLSDKFKYQDCYFKDIFEADKTQFKALELQVALYIGDMSDETVRELYKRCQNGTKHNGSEILKASGSKVVYNIMEALEHQKYLYNHCRSLVRDTDHKIYAQLYLLEEGISTNNIPTKYDTKTLEKLYEDNKVNGLDKNYQNRMQEITNIMDSLFVDRKIRLTNFESIVLYYSIRKNYNNLKNMNTEEKNIDNLINFLTTDTNEHHEATNRWNHSPHLMNPIVEKVSEILFK